MSRIRSKDTKPEMLVRKFLFSKGFRFRINDKRYPGKPDIVLPKYKTVILIHGCFWHGHDGCKYFVIPKTRTEWWQHKITTNKTNDLRNRSALEQAGWRALEIWECELKKSVFDRTMSQISEQLNVSKPQLT